MQYRHSPETSSYLSEKEGFGQRLLRFYLFLTAPKGTIDFFNAPTREQRRKLLMAYLTSLIGLICVIIPWLLSQQAFTDVTTFGACLAVSLVTSIALVLNRYRKQLSAALLLILILEFAIEGSLLQAGQLSSGWLQTFDLFLLPLAVVWALAPAPWIPLVAIIHCLFIVLDAKVLLPHSPDLKELIRIWGGDLVIFARPVLLQVSTALIGFIVRLILGGALTRLDKAEELATLREQLKRSQEQQKQELEDVMYQIRLTLAEFSGRNSKARVQVPKDNNLWQLTSTINLFLDRLEQTSTKLWQQEHSIQRLIGHLGAIARGLQEIRAGRMPHWPSKTDTPVDLILDQLQLLYPTSHQTAPPLASPFRDRSIPDNSRFKLPLSRSPDPSSKRD